MDIKDYISSGIIESYVLGLASEEEKREFEKMCVQFPELVEARNRFELQLEKQARESAIIPPANLKEHVLQNIKDFSAPGKFPVTRIGNTNWVKYAAAACLVLLAGSVFWNIYLYNQNQKLNEEYIGVSAKLKEMEDDMHVIQKPEIKVAAMKGMDASPHSFATIYWDTTSHDVYLLVNNLPQPASDKQYQLWAIINDQPVDLGVFDIKKEKLLIQAKNVSQAHAFAITLEKRGGSPGGPQGDIYVMGKL